jgi:hypothetical protein
MMTSIRTVRVLGVVGAAAIALAGCRPGDVLSVPPPIGSIGSTTLQNAAGAESEFAGATAQLFNAIAGQSLLLEANGYLTDEFVVPLNSSTNASWSNIDARYTSGVGLVFGFLEAGDQPLAYLLGARSTLLIAIGGLQQYEPASGRSKIGEAYALVGYAELLMAEDYCAGVPLSTVLAGGGYQYGTPLTTDSLLGTAEAHFNLAVANANGNDSVVALASVGLGRALLDRGQFAQAAAAVASVPATFVYNTVGGSSYGQGFTNLYEYQLGGGYGCGYMQMSDREGGNGLNFVTAGDPRLLVDSTLEQTCDGATWYYPIKFGNPSLYVPLATGVEAQLIIAEAALQAGNATTMVSDLNQLRAEAPNTYLQLNSSVHAMTTAPTVDSLHPTQAQAVDILFRERGFWLYGTGTRLEDLRRLIRQYGRDQSTVWPVGAYANANDPSLPGPLPPDYGTDVSFTLPTGANLGPTTSNPNFKGCLSPPSTP